MKTFKDLQFTQHPINIYGDEKQAMIFFDNGYGASVILGNMFYSNGVDTYEIAVLFGNKDKWSISYNTPITDDVIGGQTETQITEILKAIQKL